ncbi:MAG: YkvA family protein [Rubrivivax sp.]|jgi:uncharacterized membrane protein YkvA (DUF1232 family)
MAAWKRISVLWTVVRGDARLLWRALRHPGAPAWLKWGTALLVLYLVSPVDLLPDALPILGVLDDLVVIPMVLHAMLKRLPAHIWRDIQHPV